MAVAVALVKGGSAGDKGGGVGRSQLTSSATLKSKQHRYFVFIASIMRQTPDLSMDGAALYVISLDQGPRRRYRVSPISRFTEVA